MDDGGIVQQWHAKVYMPGTYKRCRLGEAPPTRTHRTHGM